MYVIKYLQASFESPKLEDSLKAQENLFTLVYNAIIDNLLSFYKENDIQESTNELCSALEDGGMDRILTNTAERFKESFLTTRSLDFPHNRAFYCLFLGLCPEKSQKTDTDIMNEFYILAKKLTAAIVLPVLKEYFDYYGEKKFEKIILNPRDIEDCSFVGYFPLKQGNVSQEQLPYFISKMLHLKTILNPN